MTKKIITILGFCLFAFLTSQPVGKFSQVSAATSTPSATPSVEVDKIKTIVQENIDTIYQKELAAKSFVGYKGKVKSIGSKNLTLEVDTDLLQVSILPTTSITKAGAEIKTSAIALADTLLVIGQKTKDDVLEAKIINVLPVESETDIVITKSAIATIKNLDLKKKTFTLTINSEDLSFTLSKKTTVKLDEYKDGDTILAITKKYQGKYSLSRAIKI